VSSDGTRIPYVQVGPAKETGDAPVHLYGYGGFGISMQPFYHPAIGKLWLERGGTSYEAARREGRRLAHDDFAAVAADLVRRGVTRPGRIAAEGDTVTVRTTMTWQRSYRLAMPSCVGRSVGSRIEWQVPSRRYVRNWPHLSVADSRPRKTSGG
jgi:hypothetical protein